jgi:2-iminobutanoate/2-iminopropanoate deaminase
MKMATTKTIVQTQQAPAAIGPYSQAVGFGGMFFLSGQIPMDPATGALVEGGIEAQTRRVMENLRAVLGGAGLDFSHVLRATIYLKNMSDFAAVNGVYGEYFDENPPARATIEVSRLPKDALVEIDMIAAAPAL